MLHGTCRLICLAFAASAWALNSEAKNHTLTTSNDTASSQAGRFGMEGSFRVRPYHSESFPLTVILVVGCNTISMAAENMFPRSATSHRRFTQATLSSPFE